MTISGPDTGASTDFPDASSIVSLQPPTPAAPIFAMLGDADAAACVDGACAMPAPSDSTIASR